MTYVSATGPIGAEGRYWDALVQGRLELPRCAQCGHWHWPAVWRCGECGSWDHEWTEQKLVGTVFSHTTTHHPFGGTEAFETPFSTALVQLTEVPIRLIGVVDAGVEFLRIGARASGQIAETAFAGNVIPAIRWTVHA